MRSEIITEVLMLIDVFYGMTHYELANSQYVTIYTASYQRRLESSLVCVKFFAVKSE
jgi:hypothetical protein